MPEQRKILAFAVTLNSTKISKMSAYYMPSTKQVTEKKNEKLKHNLVLQQDITVQKRNHTSN